MIRLKSWQWLILATPAVVIVLFFVIATGLQIHQWGINWIWAIFVVLFVGWRWLLVKWTKPLIDVESAIASAQEKLDHSPSFGKNDPETITKLESALQNIIQETKEDPPMWEDLQLFFQRCQDLVRAIALIYYPEEKYPLLNIYIPQAYSLIRGTVDDMDKWMNQLSPALNQVTIAQGYQGYQLYRKLEPSARKLMKVWNWAQWVLNPAVAVTKVASNSTTKQANQELLINLSQILREVALTNLARQTALLYGGDTLPLEKFQGEEKKLPETKTKALKEILENAQKPAEIEQKPVNILLVGRTGAGKSSLINTLFNAQTAEVDLLPSTTEIKNYHWKTDTGERLNLFDTPGYEQINRPEYLEKVLDYAHRADIILLLNPALDPALQMDRDFLVKLQEDGQDIPIFTVITQVDRLRPMREWQPPYDWQGGDKPKEVSIREAVSYRQDNLGSFCQEVLPIVTANYGENFREPWHDDILAIHILRAIAPAKQIRLARFFRNLEARSTAAAKIIDKYTLQMATSQGLTALLKSPVLQFISTLTTGSPQLAYILAEKIPIEQLPIVIGKLQLAYDLFSLLGEEKQSFDLLSLWTILIENNGTPDQEAWALGHGLVEYWSKNLSFNQLKQRYQYYLKEWENNQPK
ncbi:GTP-binding protein HSR1-related protein [Cyanobacterium stanieri PCC 7202]|uniref:GTP-binding protein HSR1-related protein n=1 Tax=Cyanobacterium stanieri (strain ATCC 29140 / PCC 7202) TaxID=292563 RepID=K9YLL7_CYASC|nr:GTP-binding protein HSR1-related protein [Cyanobacterium stanieri PCC 7202]